MKDKINKIFHTDRWWGKTIFILLSYLLFWCTFYGSWLLIPYNDHPVREINLPEWTLFLYSLILVPYISFIIPRTIKKIFLINNIFLYSLHIILILISVISFLALFILSALSHFSIG